MKDIIKKIQSRLSRKKISRTSQQIKDIYISMLGENDNPTEQEIKSVMDKLSDNNQIITVDMADTEIQEINTSQLVDVENEEVLQAEEIPAHSLTTTDKHVPATDKANALVFVDPFSKALAIKQSVANNEIQLTDTQVFELATNLPNEFSDQTDLSTHIINYVHEKYDLESLRSRLIMDEGLEELRNKQEQFRLEMSLKVKKTFDMMHESAMRYRAADERLLQALKDSYQKIEDRRNQKNK